MMNCPQCNSQNIADIGNGIVLCHDCGQDYNVYSPTYTIRTRISPLAAVVKAEIDQDEVSRQETEAAMLAFPWQRAFMEKVLPIEWCHKRYPKVYAANSKTA